jgi:hypothetical protein
MRRNIVFCLRNCGWLALFATLMMWAGTDPAKPNDNWRILPGGGGAITATTTRRDLVARFGAANVVDQDIVTGHGEGEIVPVTVLFPNDPKRRLEINWKDEKTKLAPEFLTIQGEKSVWHTVHGISLGTCLKQLESINGRPFSLLGFGWDFEGKVESWNNGVLDKELEGKGRVFMQLVPWGEVPVAESEMDEVIGDGPFSSSHPIMQKINPCASEITWKFP